MASTTAARLAARSFDAPDETRPFPHGKVDIARVGPVVCGRGTFEPGWRWTADLSGITGTSTCQADHVGYVLSGRMHVRMDSGEELELGPGEAFIIAPGHDAWTVGDEACVVLDFGGFEHYAKPH